MYDHAHPAYSPLRELSPPCDSKVRSHLCYWCTYTFLDDHIRRLEFHASYGVECSSLSDAATKATVQTLVTSNFHQIESVCGAGETHVRQLQNDRHGV